MHEFIGSSPLSFVGAEAQQQQYQQRQQQYTAPTIEPLVESNAERNYRDAANFCEVVAPAALGSAVVFAFHSMQVAGGSIVAIGIYQIYLAAKLTGQTSGRWTSAIVGVGVTGSMVFSLGEPIAESQQASEVKDRIGTAIKELQITRKIDAGYFNYLPSIALAIIVVCLFLKFKIVRQYR
jgi:hypothetical protein